MKRSEHVCLQVPKTAAGRTEPEMRLRPQAEQEAWSDDEEETPEQDPAQEKTGPVDELADLLASELAGECIGGQCVILTASCV